MSPISVRIGVTLSIGMLLLAAACSDARKTGAPFNSETGKHPANWIVDHRSAFLSDSGLCTTCHGSDLHGGISGISCFSASFKGMSCHANGPSGHPAGWSDPASHGASAKDVPDTSLSHGFQFCEQCHGADFTGGVVNKSCFACHGVSAPHSPAPWRGGIRTHIDTATGNAPVCALCHWNGRTPPSFATVPTGTAPGCFNATLCHAANVGTCVSCHTANMNGRRVVTGAGGDFVRTDHHVTNGTTAEIVNKDACAICHGDLVADLAHPLNTPALPNVQLMNPDTSAYTATTPTGVEQVCSGCHDSNGAARLGGSASTPFSVASDNKNPPNIGWTTGQQAHSYNTGNGAGGCLACHGNAAATGTAKKNAHGSDQSMMMQFTYNTIIAAYPATNAGNFCFNCHGTTVANGATSNIQTLFTKISKHSSEKCTDCHNPHQAKAGIHTAHTNTAGGVLHGATGAKLTTNPGFWTAPALGNFTTTTIVSGTDLEATLCFKCHTAYSATFNITSPSGSYAMTDVAREFNPNNVGNFAGTWASGETAGSFHPVLAAATSNLGRTNNVIAPWTTSSLMTCSDCHASDTTTDPNGPHGSAANFILKGPNTTWNTSVINTGSGMPAGTFCINCHNANFTNSRYPAHTNGEHNISCSKCHVMIPHGSEHPGLLHSAAGQAAGVPVPTVVNSAPYMRATTGNRLYIKSYPANNTTNWQQSNCGCNGTGH